MPCLNRIDEPFFPTVFGISALLGILFLPWGLTLFAESEQELGSLRPLNQEYIRNPIKPLTSLAFVLFGISSSFAISGTAFFPRLVAHSDFVIGTAPLTTRGGAIWCEANFVADGAGAGGAVACLHNTAVFSSPNAPWRQRLPLYCYC